MALLVSFKMWVLPPPAVDLRASGSVLSNARCVRRDVLNSQGLSALSLESGGAPLSFPPRPKASQVTLRFPRGQVGAGSLA